MTNTAEAIEISRRLVDNVSRALHGKRQAVEYVVTALLAGGHVLIEDVPGVGKTTLARALAASLDLHFRRLQLTSDLLPADVLGGSVFERDTNQFRFVPGPIFTNVLLADEINRTSPRTQSALLEAMAEGQVSIEGTTHSLEKPFFVIATQNPDEYHGTYALPESQLDRFLIKIGLGHPSPEIERELLSSRTAADPVAALESVVSNKQLLAAQAAVDDVKTTDELLDYLHALISGTRETTRFVRGASTRAALALVRAVRAFALVKGRDYATPDDVFDLAMPVLAHRLGATVDAGPALRSLLETLPVPA